VKEIDLQKYVDSIKVEAGCDFIIKTILKASATPDQKGTVSTLVEIYNCDLTLPKICQWINDAYAKWSGIREACFVDCSLKPYTVSGSTTQKRQFASSGDYLHTAIVDPSSQNESSAGTLAPIWMLSVVIFLFFRM